MNSVKNDLRTQLITCQTELLKIARDNDTCSAPDDGPVRRRFQEIHRSIVALAENEKRANRLAHLVRLPKHDPWHYLHAFVGDDIESDRFRGLFSSRLMTAAQNVAEAERNLTRDGLKKQDVLILSTGMGFEALAFTLAGFTNVVATAYPKQNIGELGKPGNYRVRWEYVFNEVRENVLEIRDNVVPHKIKQPDFAIFPEERRFQVVIANLLPVMLFAATGDEWIQIFRNCVKCADLVMFTELAITLKDCNDQCYQALMEHLKSDESLIVSATAPKPHIGDGEGVTRVDLTIRKH